MHLFRLTMFDPQNLIVVPHVDNLTPEEYNALLTEMRQAPGQKWVNQNGLRGWCVPMSAPTIEFIEDRWVENKDYSISDNAKRQMSQEKVIGNIQKSRAAKRWEYLFEDKPTDFTIPSRHTPYQHQTVAVEGMLDMPYFALLMEMGTGKTPTICWEMECYFNRMGDMDKFHGLIIVPKPLRINWYREIHKFVSDTHHIHVEMLDSALKGTEGIAELMQSDAPIKIGIISYDAVRSILLPLRLFNPNYLVLDEAHYVKSASTKRWKNIIQLADQISEQGGLKRILTGTPVSNKITDLWPQFEILRRGMLGATTMKGFANMYADLERVGDWTKVTGYKNVDRLKELMTRNSFIVNKDQCLDLPDKNYETRYVDMPPQMRKLYYEYQDTLSVRVGGKELKTDFMIAQLTKLSQMCSGFVNVPKQETGTFSFNGQDIYEFNETTENELVEIPGGDEKLREMMREALVEIVDGKLIIWCRFTHDIEKIAFLFQMEGIRCVTFYGAMSEDKRQKAVDSFNNDNDVRVFIGQPRAGGVGLTLLGEQYEKPDDYDRKNCVRSVYFYSNSYSFMERSQAEDRCHRIGQNNKVTYIDWVFTGTIDEVIADCLQNKKDLATMIKSVDEIKDILLKEPEA